jgi:hypothetical protein
VTTRPDPLDALLAQAPRALPPPRDLWPEIELQLRATRPPWIGFAIAAGLLITMTCAALTWVLLHASPSGRAPAPFTPELAAAVSLFDPPAQPAFRDANAMLERTYHERMLLLAPETRRRIDANLATIKAANDDIRRALVQDPASPLLLQLLASTLEQELDLYRDVATNTEPLLRTSRSRT